ncbi:hypothetical protein PC129_g12090 [Phytophthora cactorum]|uniref:Uncharacterized protein n=1 Tax=Phytophthora cactorum TaxID=29920 RepID=A0A8T1HVX4_9STRA|nr:hypothetical protein PC129_g12090 [Phytophthora cactorum]
MPSSKQLLQDKVRLASAGATYDGLPGKVFAVQQHIATTAEVTPAGNRPAIAQEITAMLEEVKKTSTYQNRTWLPVSTKP